VTKKKEKSKGGGKCTVMGTERKTGEKADPKTTRLRGNNIGKEEKRTWGRNAIG